MASGFAQKREPITTRDEQANRSGQKNALTPESELVQRVVATPAFTRSVLLSRFLLYICDRKLRGREEEITEFQIGVQALGRPQTYNPGEDNIVRNYARILRKRLEDYFADEGHDEAVRIVIPVGHYVPVFELNKPVASAIHADGEDPAISGPSQDSEPPSSVTKTAWLGRSRKLLIPAVLLLACSTSALVYWQSNTRPSSLSDIFWREVFDQNRTTYLVPGDSGFAMLQDITGKEVHLNDYIAGDLEHEFPDFNLTVSHKGTHFGRDRFANYTSTADLSIALGVARLAQRYNGQLTVRYARDLRMEDFKGSNVILVGGPHANPWDELFEPESNFRMVFPMQLEGMHIDGRSFDNKDPRPGERPRYFNQVTDSARLAYTLISFLPGVAGGGYVLLLEGQNMPGTQAAGDFLLDPRAMEPILKKARLADGSIGPFEILLEERTVGANSTRASVVVERYGGAKPSE